MIDKRDIINFLFVISFPVYGIGNFVSGSMSPFIGFLISLLPYLLIVLFYAIDLTYKRQFSIRVNWLYVAMVSYVVSCIAALFIALYKGLPEANLPITAGRAFLNIVPFHGFVVVCLYNDRDPDKVVRLTLLSLSILLAINVLGYYGLGLINPIHSIEGRLSMPFLDGFYSGANLLAIINLILLYYLFRSAKDPVRFTSISVYFLINLVLFYFINSRLSTLVLLLVIGLVLFRVLTVRGLFVASMFTVPLLLSCGLLLYEIFQLPGFTWLVQRVDVQDVTTFNGRAYLWMDAINWLLYDQRGLLLGNGYKGHYFLDLVHDVVKLWNAENSHHLHLHSTSLEILVNQGVFIFILFCVLFYRAYRYYRKKYQEGSEEGAFFPVVVFLLFLMQVDTFLYLEGLGFVIFSVMMARLVVKAPVEIRSAQPRDIIGRPRVGLPAPDIFNKGLT